jgi:hypothetical protein
VELNGMRIVLELILRASQESGTEVALFTHAGIFRGQPQSPDSITTGIARLVERLREQAPPEVDISADAGAILELREVDFQAFGGQPHLKLEQVYLSVADVTAFTPTPVQLMATESGQIPDGGL